MKKDGQATFVKNLIVMDEFDAELEGECKEVDISLTNFKDVVSTPASDVTPEFTYPEPHDFYMLSYTSGTTGDSKGVKMTHNMIIKQCMAGHDVL